jgi:hypothetical protein
MLKSIVVIAAVASLYGCSSSSTTSMRSPWCARPEPCGLTPTATLASVDAGADTDRATPVMYGHGRNGGTRSGSIAR